MKMSELYLFNANSAILQLYHGENKLIFHEMVISLNIFLFAKYNK
jgi:hypothetical protein